MARKKVPVRGRRHRRAGNNNNHTYSAALCPRRKPRNLRLDAWLHVSPSLGWSWSGDGTRAAQDSSNSVLATQQSRGPPSAVSNVGAELTA